MPITVFRCQGRKAGNEGNKQKIPALVDKYTNNQVKLSLVSAVVVRAMDK